MSKSKLLASLNIAERPAMGSVDPVMHRRRKLIARLEEQAAMAKAALAGETYESFTDKWVEDPETGVKKKISVPRRIKRWYFDFNGSVYLEIRYGNRPLELAPGKSAIEVGDKEKLPEVIETLIAAIQAGELDDKLMAVKKPGLKVAK